MPRANRHLPILLRVRSRRDADRTKRAIVPGCVNNLLAVSRPVRAEFEFVCSIGQSLRLAVGQVSNIDLPESLKCYLLTVRRSAHPLQHLHVELVWRDFNGEPNGLGNRSLVFDSERNHSFCSVGDVDSSDLSCGPKDDRFAIGHPGERRIDTVNRPRFLHVSFESVVNQPHCTGLSVK